MSTHIIRQNTVYIDIHQLAVNPEIAEVHELIANTLPATVDNLISIILDTYKRHIYIKTIAASVAEKFINHCNGQINYQVNNVTYQLPVRLVEDDFVTVTVVNVPYECSNEQLRQVFGTYGEIARVIQLNHAKHLRFPVDSGRRLVVFRKLPVNIPQHVEVEGHKLRVSYASQVKQCPLCQGNHLRYSCALYLADGGTRDLSSGSSLPRRDSTTTFQVTTQSRKRMLSNGKDDSDLLQVEKELHVDKEVQDQDITGDHSDLHSEVHALSSHVTDKEDELLHFTDKSFPGEAGMQLDPPRGDPVPVVTARFDLQKDFPSTLSTPSTDALANIYGGSPSGSTLLDMPPQSQPTREPSEELSTTSSLSAKASAYVSSFFQTRQTSEDPVQAQTQVKVTPIPDSKSKKISTVPKLQRTQLQTTREKGGTSSAPK